MPFSRQNAFRFQILPSQGLNRFVLTAKFSVFTTHGTYQKQIRNRLTNVHTGTGITHDSTKNGCPTAKWNSRDIIIKSKRQSSSGSRTMPSCFMPSIIILSGRLKRTWRTNSVSYTAGMASSKSLR